MAVPSAPAALNPRLVAARGVAVAIGTVTVASVATVALYGLIGDTPFALFHLAVLVSAVAGGTTAGWLAVSLAAVAGVFVVIRPAGGPVTHPQGVAAVAVSVAVAGALVVLVDRIRVREREARGRQAELERVSRLYDALSQVNHAIVTSESRDTLLERVCRALVERGGFRMAWVGWHDPATRRIVPVAAWGDTDGYLEGIDVSTDDRPQGHGPSGTAFRAGRTYVANDLSSDPGTVPWRSAALPRGYRASAAIPVRQGGEVCAVLAVYANESGYFGPREVALLEEAAANTAFGLDGFERDAERVRAKAAADRERELVDMVFDSVPGIVYLYDRDGRFQRWNRSFLEASGYTADEVAAMHPLDFFEGADRERVAARIATVFERGAASVEAGFVRKDGTATPYLLTGRRVMLDGEPCLVGMGIDISDRVEAEERLRRSEERFRQLAETISEVFWITDPAKTRMLYVSPAYETIWGRPVAELYRRPAAWLEAIHPDDRAQVTAALPLQDTGGYDITYRIVRPDGAERWIRDRAFRVDDREGAPGRIVGLAEDITERREIESQLLRVQRMESLGTLAGGIAHDLNNVLTPIMMSIDLLREDESPEGRNTTIDTIQASVQKGAEMVRQVLAFARGVQGQRTEVDIEALVADVARMANDTFLKAIEVRTVVPGDLPRIVGDPTQLHQVLVNLCVNSRDAMPQGGSLSIMAGLRHVDAAYAAMNPNARPGAYVGIAVADTGIGMTADVQERIFEPFFSTKEHGRGTGLGLSTSLAIVRSHGGFFHVESTPGAGTVIVVCIPTGGVATPTVTVQEDDPPPQGRGEMILVVDDEPGVREMTRRTLETNGYRVQVAGNGAEAIEAFKARRGEVAAVITDMMMPVMDGMTAIRALRSIDPKIPILAVSGLPGGVVPDDEPRRELAKPYTTAQLLQALDAELANSRASAPRPPRPD